MHKITPFTLSLLFLVSCCSSKLIAQEVAPSEPDAENSTQVDTSENTTPMDLPDVILQSGTIALQEEGVDIELVKISGEGVLDVETKRSDSSYKSKSSYSVQFGKGDMTFAPFSGIPENVKENSTLEENSYFLDNSSLTITNNFETKTYFTQGSIILTFQKLVPNHS